MIKVGLIGCGFMGGMHAACYEALGEKVKVVAVADVRAEKADAMKEKFGCEVYEKGMDLIANADVDVVDICLPTYLHTEHAIAAMRKGKNVFVEKPVCLTKKEGKMLLKVEKETGVKVQVGQVIRSWNEYMWIKEVVDDGRYGKITSAKFERLSPYPDWAWDNWLHKPECSGTVAMDLHVHDVDFVRYILGDPKKVYAAAGRDEKGMINHIISTYTYGDGAMISVEGTWNYPANFPFKMGARISFEKATVVLDTTASESLVVYTKEGEKIVPELKEEFQGDNEIGGNLSSLGGYYNELKYFIDGLTNGTELTVAPLSEGVKSVELVLKEIVEAGGTVR